MFLVSAHRPPVPAHILLRAMRMAGAGTQGEGEHTHSPPHGPRQMGRQTDNCKSWESLQSRQAVAETPLTFGGTQWG